MASKKQARKFINDEVIQLKKVMILMPMLTILINILLWVPFLTPNNGIDMSIFLFSLPIGVLGGVIAYVNKKSLMSKRTLLIGLNILLAGNYFYPFILIGF